MPDVALILVTTTTRASPDGLRVFTYDAGQSYGPESDPPMPAALAETFLREGWGEACGEDGQASRVHVHEAPPHEEPAEEPPEPDAACLWCSSPYTARRGHGGPDQRFCSSDCRMAMHRAARRWTMAEVAAGRVTVAELRKC